jgi:DNA-binding beta-propeller fold protein YncE
MRGWRFVAIAALAAALGALGCGSSSSSVAITVTPTTASVITNRTQQFTGAVTGSSNTAITWTLTCQSGVAANTCGSIDATGLYTAPPTIPSVTSTSSGTSTTTAEPTVTVTATAQADTAKTATATLTIVTGISIVITPTSATVGTGEFFQFTATVNNPGCNLTSNPTCENVTWSLPTGLTPANADGSIGASTGVFTAPTTVPSSPNSSTVIVTATSVADDTVTATATVSVETATTPTVTAVSPNTAALGSLFQDIYITGTNFISTEEVFINGVELASTFVTQVSTSLIRARIPDFLLAVPPSSGIFQISVSEQSGPAQTCTTDASACQIALISARPGVVGPSPDSIPQGTAGTQSFFVDGGFFGTGSNPAAPSVSATYNGQLRGIQLPASGTIDSTRQLQVSIGGGSNSNDFATPGLYPVAITSNTDPTKFAVTNLAVQTNYGNTSTLIVPATPNAIPVGSIAASAPSDVAVNPTTGVAVVANKGSNDISLINLSNVTRASLGGGTVPSVMANICTAAVGAVPTGSPAACPPSGPSGVAVDYVRNIALVVNSTTSTIAIVDLNTQAVTFVLPPLQNTPGAVGINPVSGRALVAMQDTNYGVLVDVTQNPPVYAGIVSISTGVNTRVAVEPHLNWALATPGSLGSLGIVDLNAQSSNVITAVSRINNGTANIVTVTVSSTSTAPPLSVVVGDTVQIQNVQFAAGTDPTTAALAPGFDGFYQVTSTSPNQFQFSYAQTGAVLPNVATQAAPLAASGNVNYAEPVATVGVPISVQGIAIDPETQQSVLFDPTASGVVSFFSLIDQSITSLSLETNNAADVGIIAGAYSPLTNTVAAVNFAANTLSVIDPTTPRRLNDAAPYDTRPGPIAVAVDPGTNIAVIANQTDNSVSILSLGPVQTFSITETSPKTVITASSLGSPASPSPQVLTVIGKGLTCTSGSTSLNVRLDGVSLATSCTGSGDRELFATVPPSMLATARRFAVEVVDTSGDVTNAEDFTVEQSVDVSSPSCPIPEPSGVAIDPQQNLADVTLFGCNSLALINMATGSGNTVKVGQNPIGVAVISRAHLAVVANNGAPGTASIVDESQQTVTQTVNTGSGSMGAAADEATGEVAIANSVANTVTVVNAVTGGTSTVSTGQTPIAVGFDYINHVVASADSGGNSLGISSGSGSTAESFSVTAPSSVVYDPVFTDCGSNSNGTTTNTTGCFIVASSTGNVVEVIDPVTSIQNTFRIGINPTAIAYNYRTSTLVSTNTGSHTVTIADFLGEKVRAVLSLPPVAASNATLALILQSAGTLQYALDIHPYTNVAVIADTANGQVLFLPLPY